ncbi:MAG TPA: carboxyl transferase domain-containing protein [Streptosporangiaceae bacterium]|nr:carboxyl transferase domain-containing protein [Streptosporangiaceae bacterium]
MDWPRRIAVVNRGEAACRLIHAVRELNAERGLFDERPPIKTIALYVESERDATFVREADLAYCLGPAAARPYLDLTALARALVEAGADAAWVGWGFVAEDPAFAELCERLGVTFIGPSAEAMRMLGDKIGAKLIAEKVGLPVPEWSRGPVSTLAEALEQAQRIGYPLMLKATAGGGGRGIRAIGSAGELREAYQRTSEEAERSFGNGVVFLERLVTGGRHVEVQVIADSFGTAWALGVRDCSIQRRNQKVIEESASPLLTRVQTRELKESAERLAVAAGYCGACTVEFLYHPTEMSFSFLEVNTRLQVEHPVTEATTGFDLVKAQLQVAAGGRLAGLRPAERGHAVEARLNAEDPDRDFAPAPGRIQLLRWPTGPGIRIDTGVVEGDVIPPDFDSMIAKIIAVGKDRAEALARLHRAVSETAVIVAGGATSKSFLTALLEAREVIDATADTRWVDRARAEGRLVARKHLGVALAAAAIDGYEQAESLERTRLRESGRGGRPHVRHQPCQLIDLKAGGRPYQVGVACTGAGRYRVRIEDAAGGIVVLDAARTRLDEHLSRLTVNRRTYRLATAVHGSVHVVEVDGVAHRVSRDECDLLCAPAPALVIATPVAVGAEVSAGSQVLVLESMKMETVLRAPVAARIRELLVSVGSQVESGAPLARLEPAGTDDAAGKRPTAAPVDLMVPQQAEASPPERAAAALAWLRGLVLGFDLPQERPADTIASYLADRDAAIAAGAPVRQGELDLLAAFVDIAELSSAEPGPDSHRSLREQFHTYLQSLSVDRSGVSAEFRRALERALRHYGVTELDPAPALEQAVFRMFLARERYDVGVQAVRALLKMWAEESAPGAHARGLVGRLVRALRLRSPQVADMAHAVEHCWFRRPEAAAARAAALAGVTGELRALASMPDGPEREQRIAALVDIPQPLDGLLGERVTSQYPAREPMLEVLVRRHYDLQNMRSLRTFELADRPFVTCVYDLEIQPNRTVATTAVVSVGRFDDLVPGGRLPADLCAQLRAAPDDHVRVADLYLTWTRAPATAEERSARLREALVLTGIAAHVRRIVVGVTSGNQVHPPIEYFTFRRRIATGTGEFAEDTLVRGVHPLVAWRLHLWRLQHFHVTQVAGPASDRAADPGPIDVLLYHCLAKDNAADQRLVALAQVHRFEATRGADGRITGIEDAEAVLAACVDAVGRVRHDLDPAGQWPDLNHVWLDIRPVVNVGPEDLAAWQRAAAPLVAQAGIHEVLLQGRLADADGALRRVVTRLCFEPGESVAVSVEEAPTRPLAPLTDYDQKVLRARRRGTVYPYELVRLLTSPCGEFTELELRGAELGPADRPRGYNTAGIVAGLVSTPTSLHPEGIRRVVLLGDPTKALGALAEPECARIIAALNLAEREGLPLEWFAVSAGARISTDSGTENMDWIARVLRRIVEFTQGGGEINIVVAGINVGAQPYWNAEATMLMHTSGILVMTPASAMVLTGKQSLDFSGGVSAEDNFGIGGYARVMGPNGQAQYWAPNLAAARDVLMSHYEYTYLARGESVPRRALTADPVSRDVTRYPHSHPGADFTSVGEIFSAEANLDRKKPFDIRAVMRAVSDQDHRVIERWADMAEAETAVVVDARIGGWPVCLIGIESRPAPRLGFPPADGPGSLTAGTLFPLSSKKIARAINAASGRRPVVVLANLSGFDGSPESMRRLQLEYGAEIGRAVVNFDGKVVFCVISRYHGGAFVVFSKALNDNMTVLAVEGSFASVIGGAPAAAVVFARQVDARTAADPRVTGLEAAVSAATQEKKAELVSELAEVRAAVRAEKLSALGAEFDAIHSIQRAVEVGSVDAVIAARQLRYAIAEQIDTWMHSERSGCRAEGLSSIPS